MSNNPRKKRESARASTPKSKKKTSKSAQTKAEKGVACSDCGEVIRKRDQALFVEEDVGRYFCSEACIVSCFTDEIETLEQTYGRHLKSTDLSPEERERYAHLRWVVLEEPGEAWRVKTKAGDYRYTLISEFKPDGVTVYGVAICLMLRGEPSFMYLAFVTNDLQMVSAFKNGEKLKLYKEPKESSVDPSFANEVTTASEEDLEASSEIESEEDESMDRLAEPWTESDSLQVSILKNRKDDDIPLEDFSDYQSCLEETLQAPNELWSYVPDQARRVYHFIREYEASRGEDDYWYVVMAKDTEDETQIEIIEAFPTNSANLVELCRHGRKEALSNEEAKAEAEAAEGIGFSEEKVRRNIH